MLSRLLLGRAIAALMLVFGALPAGAQNFMVQCPANTLWHPAGDDSTADGANLYASWPNLSTRGEPPYTGPQTYSPPLNLTNGVPLQYVLNGGAVKCQQISGGDGYMTEADGNQTFMFAFGPLSGLQKIRAGADGTDYPDEFNQPYCDPSWNGGSYNNKQPNPYVNGGTNPMFPTTVNGGTSVPNTITCGPNGAVGYQPPAGFRSAVGQAILAGTNQTTSATPTGVAAVVLNDPSLFPNATPGAGYASPPNVLFASPQDTNGCTSNCVTATGATTIGLGSVIEVAITNPGNGYISAPAVTFVNTSPSRTISGTDPAAIMNTGVMNGNIPAPEIAMDEDDELFLDLTNVGMIMRPDLFEQHTVHFHGYPNASSFYDGVPDASLAINIGATFTYYYLAPDAGTYFWHCHITPPEHLQMGMVGQLFVRPRQNRLPVGTNLYQSLAAPAGAPVAYGNGVWGLSQQSDPRTACNLGTNGTASAPGTPGESNLYVGSLPSAGPTPDILCSVPSPAKDTGATAADARWKYVYNDGDGSTRYDVETPIQMHDFDPNFHFVGMTFNPEGFEDMKGKYFLLNGRSYPDTMDVRTSSVTPAAGWTGGLPDGTTNPDVGTHDAPGSNAILTAGSDGQSRPEQPIPTLIVLSQHGAPDGGPDISSLRLVNLSVEQYHTIASLGIPMHIVGWNAKMLRDEAGNNMDYYANSITIGGGESMDALLDACAIRGPAPTYTCLQPVPVGTYFLYTPNLDHLANDAENFGGMMTEVVVTP